MNKYINNCNIHDIYKLNNAVLRYNAYCYILIQIYISKMNKEYNVLYHNFYNTWEDINDLSLSYTPEEILLVYDSVYESDYCKFIEMFIYFNDIKQHPLKYKYKSIENTSLYECNICFNDFNINYFKCNTCIFKLCNECYNNHMKHNIKNCTHCRN